jgi:hypothetical protein
MNTFIHLRHLQSGLVAIAVGLMLTTASPLGAAEDKPAGDTLHVRVTTPPTPSPTAEQDVSEFFVDQLADVFRGRGFTGKIEELDRLDDAPEDALVLHINLVEWERSRTNNFTCRFSAKLDARGTEHQLGSFQGMTPGLATGSGRFGRERGFEEAADSAIRDLFDALAKTEVVTGLRKK